MDRDFDLGVIGDEEACRYRLERESSGESGDSESEGGLEPLDVESNDVIQLNEYDDEGNGGYSVDTNEQY